VVELNLDALSETKSKPQMKIGNTAQTKIGDTEIEKCSAAAEILGAWARSASWAGPRTPKQNTVQATVTKASSKIHA
jgi:hypothetical protein